MNDRNYNRDNWEDNFCSTNQLRIHYTRTGGKKPSIILLHGLVANGMCWKNIAQPLSYNFDVIMPDARGHGKSSTPICGYTYENLANDVIHFITAINLPETVLLGHSMGGMTAALAASQSPSVRAVILAEPTFLSPAKQFEVWNSNVIEQHKKLLEMSLDELISDKNKAHPYRSRESNELLAKARLQTSINAFQILKPPYPDYKSVVKKLKCPCLLLYGDNGIIDSDTANNLCKLNSFIKTFEIKNAGHGIYLDQPLQFVNSIIKFLTDLN